MVCLFRRSGRESIASFYQLRTRRTFPTFRVLSRTAWKCTLSNLTTRFFRLYSPATEVASWVIRAQLIWPIRIGYGISASSRIVQCHKLRHPSVYFLQDYTKIVSLIVDVVDERREHGRWRHSHFDRNYFLCFEYSGRCCFIPTEQLD